MRITTFQSTFITMLKLREQHIIKQVTRPTTFINAKLVLNSKYYWSFYSFTVLKMEISLITNLITFTNQIVFFYQYKTEKLSWGSNRLQAVTSFISSIFSKCSPKDKPIHILVNNSQKWKDTLPKKVYRYFPAVHIICYCQTYKCSLKW